MSAYQGLKTETELATRHGVGIDLARPDGSLIHYLRPLSWSG
ncbi:hypothetical protein [Dactylosporangium sp. NPDC000521]